MAEDKGKTSEDQEGVSVERPKGAFLCHSSKDSDFVIKVAGFLQRNFERVFYYEEHQMPNKPFWETIKDAVSQCEVFIGFFKEQPTAYQLKELRLSNKIRIPKKKRSFIFCLLEREDLPSVLKKPEFGKLSGYPQIKAKNQSLSETKRVAEEIMKKLHTPFIYDGLPSNPHLFSYEKDIINHLVRVSRFKKRSKTTKVDSVQSVEDKKNAKELLKRRLEGCPTEWPQVQRLKDKKPNMLSQEYERITQDQGTELTKEKIKEKVNEWESKVGRFREEDARVIVASLTDYHKPAGKGSKVGCCLMDPKMNMCFPEAGPRDFLHFPRKGRRLRVAVLVSGGIAPGTNSVIDGIVQRHLQYAQEFDYWNGLSILGIKNGFIAFDNWGDNKSRVDLKSLHLNISYRASEGGSLLGTSRVDKLLENSDERWDKLNDIIGKLYASQVDILYIIGGDGSMRAAHALWTVAQEYAEVKKLKPHKLSVVAIPKTMDNDILWVWQTFGFLSAVEKAREIIDHLETEVESNPRLCVAQLFGSDSGFVVSHAVLASRPTQCDAALIPEVKFSIKKLAHHLKAKMSEREDSEFIRRGLVVMAETAIPVDAMDFVNERKGGPLDIGLTEREKEEIVKLMGQGDMNQGGEVKRIPGQTSDDLRSAGLKIVSKGLKKLLDNAEDVAETEQELRVVTNEPRHLLRALPPSSTDIIMGNRLGTLAVDNALAGYTDFMVSQWLTEYVLVPLELVVLGRKRIPETGIFWKSVIAKTGQPANLT